MLDDEDDMTRTHVFAISLLLTACPRSSSDTAGEAKAEAEPKAEADAKAEAKPKIEGEREADDELVFAVVGDYGEGDANERAVAELVNGWEDITFVVSLGDNNYGDFDVATYDERVCGYYPKWAKPAAGESACTASTNAFYPTPGNHDCHVESQGSGATCQTTGDFYTAYASFFDWPNKPTGEPSTLRDEDMYYSFSKSAGAVTVQLYAFNANCAVTDKHGCDENSGSHGCSDDGCAGAYQRMADRIKQSQQASNAAWSLVYFHQTPFSLEGDSPCTGVAALDFASSDYNDASGRPLSAVLAGHSHNYQRFTTPANDQVPFFVNGTGGTELDGCPSSCTMPAGTSSALCYPSAYPEGGSDPFHGAMKVRASAEQMTLEYYTVDKGDLVDTCTLTRQDDGSQVLSCAGAIDALATVCTPS